MSITPAEIEKAKAGEKTAAAAVIAHMMPAVQYAARRLSDASLEREDAVQEGILAVFRAIQAYTPEKGAGFDTFATVCIRNGILSARRAAHGRWRHAEGDGDELQQLPAGQGPEELAIQKEAYRERVRAIRTGLSPLEQKVLLAFLDGHSYQQIAHSLGISPKAVDNALNRVRSKLK